MSTYVFHTIEQNINKLWQPVKNTNTVQFNADNEPEGTSLVREFGSIYYHSEIEALKATVLPMLDYIDSANVHVMRDAKGILRIDNISLTEMFGLDPNEQQALIDAPHNPLTAPQDGASGD